MSAYPSIRERLFRLAPVASTESVPVLCIRFLLILMSLLVIGVMIAFGVKPVGMWMHRHRFILGASVIAACVLLNISGSSIGMWNYWLGHDMSTDVVWGTPRIMRTDEYVVGTPLAFSQSYSGYSYFNDLFGNKPADMFIVKDAPVLALAELFRPFHWGYILFGSSRGLAFYWSARLVVLFLAAYEFFLCISNDRRQEKHKGVAFVGAILIACARWCNGGSQSTHCLRCLSQYSCPSCALIDILAIPSLAIGPHMPQ